jgi:ketosteroid isomerase-like protein
MQGADVIRTYFAAFAARDRAGVERLMADGFSFTSPYDDHIDRATYFERCWPVPAGMQPPMLTVIRGEGADWFVRYDAKAGSGSFTNVEHFVVRRGRIERVRVFFGEPAKGDGDA